MPEQEPSSSPDRFAPLRGQGVGMFRDLDGQPCDLATYAEIMESPARIIGRDEIDVDGRPALLSTVYLGVDNGIGPLFARMYPDEPAPPPLIFETALLDDSDESPHIIGRYPTAAAALAGHDQALAALRDGHPLDS